MSLSGKLLALLNVLAAAGFFLVAGMDWSKRVEWADMVLQHDLVIKGLPLNEQEKNLEGNPRVNDIRKAVLQQMFQKSGGQPVPTQEDEVKRVRSQIQAKIDDPAAKETKLQKLGRIMLVLAPNQDRWEKVKAMVADANNAAKNTEEFQKELNEYFDAVLSPTIPTKRADGSTGTTNRDADEKRRAIAHCLFRMSEILQSDENPPPASLVSSKAYERTVTVVGLRAAAQAMDDQAYVLKQMTADARAALLRDRDGFLVNHRTLLDQIEDLSEKVALAKGTLKTQKELVEKEKVLVEGRKQEVQKVEDDLAQAQKATKEQLDIQSRMEKELFKSQQEMRDAFDKNKQLEKELHTLEKGR